GIDSRLNKADLLGIDSRPSQAQWRAWAELDGAITSAPTATAWNNNARIDLFVRGSENQLLHRWLEANRWSEWESLGGDLRSAPSCVSWNNSRIDCFAAMNWSNGLWHIWWDGIAWSGWEDLGGGIT